MTETNDDEPAPETLTYPDTLRITIQSGEDAFADALTAAGVVESGGQEPAVVSFETTEGVRRLLTDRRLEVIRSLMTAPADSISALAERLDRNYSTVHEDVSILAEYGIVQFRESGSSKAPFVPYESVEFDVTVRANHSEEREASA
jgi:predicted transcriptional regulator